MSSQEPPLSSYCTRCAEPALSESRYCIRCGAELGSEQGQDVRSVAYLLNQLTEMRRRNEISLDLYHAALVRYGELLERLQAPKPAVPESPTAAPPPPRPAPVERRPSVTWTAVASWGVSQAPSLLLFVGAFLMVMAALIFVAAAGEGVTGGGQFALILAFTVGFVVVGWVCYRYPRVVLAGRVFFGIGALLTPLTFAAAYNFVLEGRAFPADALWLAGSTYSLVFYGAVALLGMGRLYSYLAAISLLVAWGSLAVVLNLPAEWMPGVYVVLAGGLSVLSWRRWRWSRELFAKPALLFAHVVAGIAVVITVTLDLGLVLVDDGALWFLPVTLALGAAFYAAQRPPRDLTRVAALALVGGTAIGMAAALRLDAEYYGVTLAVLGIVYAAGWFVPHAKAYGWRRPLWPLALIAATLASIPLLDVYQQHPLFGFFILLAMAVVYFVGWSFHVRWLVDLTRPGESGAQRLDPQTVKSIGHTLLYAAGAAFGGSYYFLLHGLFDLPMEWLPAFYIALVIGLALLSRQPWRWLPSASSGPVPVLAHLVAGAAVVIAILLGVDRIAAVSDPQLWFLPVTLALGAILYALQRPPHILNQVAALVLAGGTAIGVVMALRLDAEYYGATLAALGIVYAAGWFVPRVKAYEWRRPLWPLALIAATVASLPFIGVYLDHPSFGAAVLLATALVYFVGGGFHASWLEAIASLSKDWAIRLKPETVTTIGRVLVFAGSAALSVSYYLLLRGVLDIALEWLPAMYVVLAIVRSVFLRQRWLGLPPATLRSLTLFAHLMTGAAVAFAVGLTLVDNRELWFLPVTLALGAAFYAIQRPPHALNQVATLVLAGTATLGVVAALRLDTEYYGVALAALGIVYAAGWFVPWTRFEQWRRPLWPLGLLAAALGSILFLVVYLDHPLFGAFALLAAALVYVVGAGLHASWVKVARITNDSRGLGIGLLYAGGVALSGGYLFLLRGVLGPEALTEATEVAFALFPLSLGVAMAAATTRWWNSEWRAHLYLIAMGLSLVVITSGAPGAAGFFGYLAIYTAIAIAVAAWERRPLWAAVAFAYGFPAMIAFARYAEMPDEYWAAIPAAIGALLYMIGMLRRRAGLWWSVVRYGGFALVGAATAEAFILLADRSGRDALTGIEAVESALYLASTAMLGVLGLVVLGEAWRRRHVSLALTAGVLGLATLMMGVGHFHPENIQAYTIPGGIYTLVVAIMLRRVRKALPVELRDLPGWLEVGSALAILGPGLLRSVGDEAYAPWVLAQAVAILVVGVVLQRRLLVLPAVAFIGIIAFQFVVDVAQTLPGWVSLGTAGALLLSLGFLLLLGRNAWSRWQRVVVEMWGRWER